MVSSDAFELLASGSKFGGSRFKSEMALFRRGGAQPGSQQAVAQGGDDSAPPPELDFFGTQGGTSGRGTERADADDSGSKMKKRKAGKLPARNWSPTARPSKRKRAKGVAESVRAEGAEGDDVDIFSSHNVRHPVTIDASEGVAPNDDHISQLRAKHRITVKGDSVPAPIASFDELQHRYQVKQFVVRNVDAIAKYSSPTPIQMQAIPALLSGRELLAYAPTGSGKTAAFVVPMICLLKLPANQGPRGLIISPTRELALQTYKECKKLTHGKKFRIQRLTKATAAGHNYIAGAAEPLAGGCDIMIATPLRLIDGVNSGSIDLSHVQLLVMDESDKLFELGFIEQADEVLAACTNSKLQRALFSATVQASVETLALTVLSDPVHIQIGTANATTDTIKQKLVYAGNEEGKLLALRQIFGESLQPPTLIFVQTKERAKELFRELIYDDLNVDVIHADRTHAQREKVVDKFRTGKVWVLIATDLMARGIDFKAIHTVINYDFPQNVVNYIHRIGRTGRAGRQGRALTFFTQDDIPMLKSIANVMKISGCVIPDWMMDLKSQTRSVKRDYAKRQPMREHINTMPKHMIKKNQKRRQYIMNSKITPQ